MVTQKQLFAQVQIKERVEIKAQTNSNIYGFFDTLYNDYWIREADDIFPKIKYVRHETNNKVCAGDPSWYSLIFIMNWYNEAHVLDGAQYIKYHYCDDPECECTSFSELGDNFLIPMDLCTWASFDENRPQEPTLVRVSSTWNGTCFDEHENTFPCPFTKILTFVVFPGQYVISDNTANQYLYYGESININAGAFNECNDEMPETIYYNAAIVSGAEYGSLKDINTDQTGSSIKPYI